MSEPINQPEALRLADIIGGDCAAELRRLHVANAELTECLEKKSIAIQRIWKERDELRAEVERLRALYNDLIMCVGNKHPGESRHETAKRYLINAESPVISTASAALKEPK